MMQEGACGLNEGQYYKSPLRFNMGIIPRTLNCLRLGGDGGALDFVDLSRNGAKPILTIADFKVLGVLGLIHDGKLDYKIVVLDAEEAQERAIHSLQDLNK